MYHETASMNILNNKALSIVSWINIRK